MEVHIGVTWRIRMNRACAVAMRTYLKLLSPLVTFLMIYRNTFFPFRENFAYYYFPLRCCEGEIPLK